MVYSKPVRCIEFKIVVDKLSMVEKSVANLLFYQMDDEESYRDLIGTEDGMESDLIETEDGTESELLEEEENSEGKFTGENTGRK